ALDLESAGRFYDVVTDEIRPGADRANYLPTDIIRRADLSGVDIVLLKVGSPENSGNQFIGTGHLASLRNVPGDVELPALFGVMQQAYRPGEPIDNGYIPLTLQYREYYADPATVRARPIGVDAAEDARWVAAGGRPGMSRYYGGKSAVASNESELDFILEISAAARGIPVALAISMRNPMVFSEFESAVDAIVVSFGTSDAAILEALSGRSEPNGLLPFQMPLNMAVVERQLEDVPFDMACYVDGAGNVYDFGFGLNWSGPISDGRKARYDAAALAAFMRGVVGYSFW
ncbi:MAG: glycoside hydrolase family 3 C-terminal domain-containing protein, partial [Treponema sp.]|nr:glycoside hydrolase family 3 C-terminal domain-containing protein [Treponema sp.]